MFHFQFGKHSAVVRFGAEHVPLFNLGNTLPLFIFGFRALLSFSLGKDLFVIQFGVNPFLMQVGKDAGIQFEKNYVVISICMCIFMRGNSEGDVV
jgi:hypothetical protein